MFFHPGCKNMVFVTRGVVKCFSSFVNCLEETYKRMRASRGLLLAAAFCEGASAFLVPPSSLELRGHNGALAGGRAGLRGGQGSAAAGLSMVCFMDRKHPSASRCHHSPCPLT